MKEADCDSRLAIADSGRRRAGSNTAGVAFPEPAVPVERALPRSYVAANVSVDGSRGTRKSGVDVVSRLTREVRESLAPHLALAPA